MEFPLLGLILDKSVIIAAERKRQTVDQLLTSIGQTFGDVEIAISAVTLSELVHGVARANTPEVRNRTPRAYADKFTFPPEFSWLDAKQLRNMRRIEVAGNGEISVLLAKTRKILFR